ncbi:related to arginine-tRNA-protein transferase [Cephalotrichum gorgonifer]|uniref:Related to arginine-tRNA-protein transferase n=1 Tax=Cephalotrichum gorgonifer TaxID=2041049 RepID=A0AAE8SSE8_9PEZI|nr:related to arginine-tRNA-protein transferase [Cephalotrichum gorgonifer]
MTYPSGSASIIDLGQGPGFFLDGKLEPGVGFNINLTVLHRVERPDQRQAVNRFNKYILGEKYAREAAILHPRSRAEAKKRDNTFDLLERIHEAESAFLKPEPKPSHNLTVTLEDDSFTEEKYLVFENYQMRIHKEKPGEVSRNGFTRFLCNSPITKRTETLESGQDRRLGSFHQCYRIDGELVAVGVIDLLPQSVSAVYFFYHESIHKFCPGKLGALREISLAREGGYRWWYPGFYIHGCPKMRYKIDYTPQFILDPETLVWETLDERALAILDKPHYVGISKGLKEGSEGASADVSMDTPPLSSPGQGADLKTESSDDATEGGEDEDEAEEADLFSRSMPGIPSLETMMGVDLDHIPLRLSTKGALHKTSDLVLWEDLHIDEGPSIKLVAAELVAAIGVDLLGQFCLDFSRRR